MHTLNQLVYSISVFISLEVIEAERDDFMVMLVKCAFDSALW